MTKEEYSKHIQEFSSNLYKDISVQAIFQNKQEILDDISKVANNAISQYISHYNNTTAYDFIKSISTDRYQQVRNIKEATEQYPQEFWQSIESTTILEGLSNSEAYRLQWSDFELLEKSDKKKKTYNEYDVREMIDKIGEITIFIANLEQRYDPKLPITNKFLISVTDELVDKITSQEVKEGKPTFAVTMEEYKDITHRFINRMQFENLSLYLCNILYKNFTNTEASSEEPTSEKKLKIS